MTLKVQDGKYLEKGGAGGMVETSEGGAVACTGSEVSSEVSSGVAASDQGGGGGGPAGARGGVGVIGGAGGEVGGTGGAGIAEVGESSKDSHRAGGVSNVVVSWGGDDVADGGVDEGGEAGGAGMAGLERGERRSSLSFSSSVPRRSSASLRRLRTRLAGGGFPSGGDREGADTQAVASASGEGVAAEAVHKGVAFTQAGTAAYEDGGCRRD
jgi:hypothetical protein